MGGRNSTLAAGRRSGWEWLTWHRDRLGRRETAGALCDKSPSRGASPIVRLRVAVRRYPLAASARKFLAIAVSSFAVLVAVPLAAAEPTPPRDRFAGERTRRGARRTSSITGRPGKNIGFEVELAQLIARELGRPIEFHQYDFKSLVRGWNGGTSTWR